MDDYRPTDEPFVLIPLRGMYGQGLAAKVSLEDAELARRYKWWCTPAGYAYTSLPRQAKRKNLALHHLVLPPRSGMHVDHRNGDKLDCTRHNLRYATPRENLRNRRLNRLKGVTRVYKNTWTAKITLSIRRAYTLGTYQTAEDAARAYDAAARHYYGEFAATNFPGTEAASVEQLRKASRLQRSYSSKFRNVTWDFRRERYVAEFTYQRKRHLVGQFISEYDAARAVDSARIALGLPPVNFLNEEQADAVDQAAQDRQARKDD